MANIDLTKYGITGTTEIVYNPSYEDLYKADRPSKALTRAWRPSWARST